MDSWKMAIKEGFDYRRYSDKTAIEFIQQNYDKRTVKAYISCAVPAMKADFFRYCALLVHPGLYVDADVRRAADIRPLYRRLERGLLFMRKNQIANDFIVIKEKNDPLLALILETAISNIEKRTSNNVWEVTGPGIASRLFKTLGPLHSLFKKFEIFQVKEVRKYIRFNWRLEYKTTDAHWVEHQKLHSIFIQPECLPYDTVGGGEVSEAAVSSSDSTMV